MDRIDLRRRAAKQVSEQIKENLDHSFDPKEDVSRNSMAFDIIDRLDSLGLIYYLDPDNLAPNSVARNTVPIPMRLSCPECNAIHIDEGEFATKPHHTHACQSCGMVWRPAVVPTVGVRFLPGFKNAAPGGVIHA